MNGPLSESFNLLALGCPCSRSVELFACGPGGHPKLGSIGLSYCLSSHDGATQRARQRLPARRVIRRGSLLDSLGLLAWKKYQPGRRSTGLCQEGDLVTRLGTGLET